MNVSKSTAIKFLQGDETAFAEVYSRYHRLLYFLISTYVDTKEDCEDVYQDVFLKMWNARYTFGNQIDPAGLHSYLCTVAKTTSIDFARAKSRRRAEELIEDEQGEPRHTRLSELLPYDISDEEREVVGYRVCFGFSFKEINAITGAPIATLKKRYARALAKMKGALK